MSFADLIAKKSGMGDDESPEAGLQPSPTVSLEAFIQKFAHVTESYWFYDHTVELRFNTEEHKYYRVGELGNLIPVNGVTNTVGIKDKSFMLTPWAAKVAIQKLLRLIPTEMVEGTIRIKPLTFEEFTTIALEAKSAHKDKLDEASDIGHAAHKCLEDSINHAIQNDPQRIVRTLIALPADELANNAAGSGFAWMLQHNVRWQETESKVYSREFDYAGTMDGLAICDSCEDKACCPVPFKDRLSLIDWKSSNHLNLTYLFQVASYKKAKTEEFPALNIEDIWILRLGKSEEEAGKFEPWHLTPDEYEEDLQGFLACLTLTRLVDSVEERMKGQKSSIRAIRKEQKATAKAIAKEQEKLQKALDKAAAKLAKEAEKVRIKAEAKAERERLKAEKKAGATCGSTLQETTEKITTMLSDSLPLAQPSLLSSPSTPVQETRQPEQIILTEAQEYPLLTDEVKAILEPTHVQRPSNAVVDVEVLILSPEDQAVVVEAITNPPEPNEALKEAAQRYEEEATSSPYKLPME